MGKWLIFILAASGACRRQYAVGGIYFQRLL